MAPSMPALTVLSARRLVLAALMVGGPLLLLVSQLIAPPTSDDTQTGLEYAAAHPAQVLWAGSLSAVGFLLLVALGLGMAVLAPRRVAGVLTTVGAVLIGLTAPVFGVAIAFATSLDEAFARVAPAGSADLLTALQTDSALGLYFELGLVAEIGALISAIGLILARSVPIWAPIVLIVGLVASYFLDGGFLGAVGSLLLLVPAVVFAQRLVAPATTRARAREVAGV